MGPITPNEGGNKQDRQRQINWIDNSNDGTQNPGLVTSFSKDDLVHKEEEEVAKVETHYRQNDKKSAIKIFKLDLNSITGIPNFNDLSKDPFKIPQHGLEIDRHASEPISG